MKPKLPIIIGNSNVMVSISEKISKLANLDVPILIVGEHGTGKDFIAESIFHYTQKKQDDYLKIDCSILEDELNYVTKQITQSSDNEFFFYFDGIEKLNEYGQAVLHRAVEKKEVVIHNSSLSFHVRVVASADPIIVDLVKQGLFREDLFWKLSTLKLNIPPLKERKEDIPLLIHHFIKILNAKYDKNVNRITEDLTKFLLTNNWVGNVKQLKNLLEGMIALTSKRKVSLKDVPKEFISDIPTTAKRNIHVTPGIPLQEYEKQIIKANLEFMNGNRLQTAKILGISERNLYRKIKEYNMG